MKLTKENVIATADEAQRQPYLHSPTYTPYWLTGFCQNVVDTIDDYEARLQSSKNAYKAVVKTNDANIKELAEAKSRLESLMPKPRFHVKQVVVVRETSVPGRIGAIKFYNRPHDNSWTWAYQVAFTPSVAAWYDEGLLREISEEEK